MNIRPLNWLLTDRRIVRLMGCALVYPLALAPGPLFGLQSGPNALAGAQLFGSKGCVTCHAVRGMGGTEGPDLGTAPQLRTFYDLAADMWNHLPRMVSRMRELGLDPPQLAQWEAADLIAFLATVHYFDPPGDLEHGERLFREKRCVVCHQAGGLGGVVGPDLSVVAQHDSPLQIAAAMWNHGPSMVQAMQERGIERPGFAGSELIDLISYVESVSSASYQGPLFVVPGAADQGRTLYEQKGCARCHGIHGQGGGGAPSLSGRGRDQSLTQFAAAMWNKAPAMLRQMRSMGIQVPDLRADEMADIVAFLYTVRYFSEAGDPTVGRRQLQSKGCRRCHSLDGRGGTGAPDLAAARGLDTPEAVISAMWNHAVIPAEEGEEAQWPGLTPPEMANFVSFFQASPDAR